MHARIGMAGVVGASSRLDAELTAVRQDKGTTSRGHNKMLLKLCRLPAIAPHLIGRQVYGSSLYQGALPGELLDIDDHSGYVALYQLDAGSQG